MLVKNVDELEDKIGLKFNQKNLLIEALSHTTYLKEHPDFKDKLGLADGHNQRLEHFGDSILGFLIAERLYHNYPGREGNLTKIKEYFVNGNKLKEISADIGLEKFMNMGIGESKTESGREKRIRDALEALIAAIYIDKEEHGYENAKKFVDEFFLYDLDYVLENFETLKNENDPISYLQRIVHTARLGNPTYKTTRVSGDDHDPNFLIEVFVNNEKITEVQGKKKDIKRKAAENAIESKFIKNLLSYQR